MDENMLSRAVGLAGLELSERRRTRVEKYMEEMLAFMSPLADVTDCSDGAAELRDFDTLRDDTAADPNGTAPIADGKGNADGLYVAPLAVN